MLVLLHWMFSLLKYISVVRDVCLIRQFSEGSAGWGQRALEEVKEGQVPRVTYMLVYLSSDMSRKNSEIMSALLSDLMPLFQGKSTAHNEPMLATHPTHVAPWNRQHMCVDVTVTMNTCDDSGNWQTWASEAWTIQWPKESFSLQISSHSWIGFCA